MIEFSLEDVNVPGLDSEHFALWLERVVLEEGFELGDINLVFCSDEALLKMNINFLQHDYYTDIITFDYCEDGFVSGDLFISIDRVIDNAVELKTDYDSELKRVCVHGVLHLCGYKDKSDEDEKQMRLKEDFYLKKYVPRET
ncbi:MAG: rRNA maturation RNase YbeY [Crocinitomicaceae bacterium]|nr:MAG: rRNA maturation RNase YbeY [Crocinitomicaceae bacterium]